MQCKIAQSSCLKGIGLHRYSFGLSFCVVRVDGEGKGEEASGTPAAVQQHHMLLHAPGSAPLLARQDVKYLCGTRAHTYTRLCTRAHLQPHIETLLWISPPVYSVQSTS